MGQVASINEANETVAEILNHPVSEAQVAQARAFVESFAFTTSALLAIEVALREQYRDLADEGIETVEGAPLADLVAGIIRQAAALEAVEL